MSCLSQTPRFIYGASGKWLVDMVYSMSEGTAHTQRRRPTSAVNRSKTLGLRENCLDYSQ